MPLNPFPEERIEDLFRKTQSISATGVDSHRTVGIEGKPKEEATQTQLKFLPVATTDFILHILGRDTALKGW